MCCEVVEEKPLHAEKSNRNPVLRVSCWDRGEMQGCVTENEKIKWWAGRLRGEGTVIGLSCSRGGG